MAVALSFVLTVLLAAGVWYHRRREAAWRRERAALKAKLRGRKPKPAGKAA